MEEEVGVPGGDFSLEGEADVVGVVLAHDVGGQPLEQGEVPGRLITAHTRGIFVPHHVQNPVLAVLDLPVRTDGLPDARWVLRLVRRQRGEVEGAGGAGASPAPHAALATALDHDHALQAAPLPKRGVHELAQRLHRHHAHPARLVAPVPGSAAVSRVSTPLWCY